jgi:hypothetical protein
VELADGSKSVYKGVVIAVGYEAKIRLASKFHAQTLFADDSLATHGRV